MYYEYIKHDSQSVAPLLEEAPQLEDYILHIVNSFADKIGFIKGMFEYQDNKKDTIVNNDCNVTPTKLKGKIDGHFDKLKDLLEGFENSEALIEHLDKVQVSAHEELQSVNKTRLISDRFYQKQEIAKEIFNVITEPLKAKGLELTEATPYRMKCIVDELFDLVPPEENPINLKKNSNK